MLKRLPAVFVVLLSGCLADDPTAVAQPPPNAEVISAELDDLLAMTDLAEQRLAIHETANRWAKDDPATAYSVVLARPVGEPRDTIESSLIWNWIAVDSVSALRFFASLDAPPPSLSAASRIRGTVSMALPISPESDLVEVFALANQFPGEIARLVRFEALRSIVRSDPRSAAQFATSLPAEEQHQAGMNIARAYTAVDPDAALAWARDFGVPDVEHAVVEAMAAQNPYGMLARALSGDEGVSLSLVASGAFAAQGLDKAQFGTALAQLPRTPASAQAVSTYTQTWLVRDQAAALEWLATVTIELPSEAIFRAASRAGDDQAFAASFAQRLQGRNRSEWIENVAAQYGREDPARALGWLEPFRTDPAYPKIVAGILPGLALTAHERLPFMRPLMNGILSSRLWLKAGSSDCRRVHCAKMHWSLWLRRWPAMTRFRPTVCSMRSIPRRHAKPPPSAQSAS
jgi:hypothetical protein